MKTIIIQEADKKEKESEINSVLNNYEVVKYVPVGTSLHLIVRNGNKKKELPIFDLKEYMKKELAN